MRSTPRLPILAACLLLAAASAAGTVLNLPSTIQRPLRYQPDGGDFLIRNGPELFNRPLYTNTAFRVDGGDRPQFSLFLPGRGGVLRLGVRSGAAVRWLDQAASVTARYRAGSLLYGISDPAFPGRTLRLAALVLPEGQGLIVRVAAEGTGPALELFWAYGGADGYRGRRDGDIGTEAEPVSEFFQLRPEHCRDSRFDIGPTGFILRSPVAFVRGTASAGARYRVGDARKWNSPAELLAPPPAKDPPPPPGLPVVLGSLRLPDGGGPRFIALQRIPRAGDGASELAVYREVRASAPGPAPAGPSAVTLLTGPDLPRIFAAAEARRRGIAGRITVDTPDPFVNAAAPALCAAADGIWDEPSGTVQHGAVAWRARLLGWRGPYANDELGWHQRARRDFETWAARQNTSPIPARLPPADVSANLSRNEAALHSNGDISDSHYDMNLVYIDQVIRHVLWTGDLGFARRLWPVIQRHLAWERRLFRRAYGPEGLPLYEGYACIWASDDLEYEGGGAAHSSAYNYYENAGAARIARLIGADPAPYEREAGLIWRAMHRELWLPQRGWFGEWKDLLGRQMVHPSPALWTFYHTVDSGAATPFEAWEMTRFIDTRIAHIPLVGPGMPPEGDFMLPTTDWMPYTWSTNNVVMAEVMHTSLGYWQSGRPDEAFRMFKGALLTSMYAGLCPGNLGMTTSFDMARGEAQRDFGDAIGITARALVEGLFGVAPDAPAGELRIQPGFPAGWDRARLAHPDFDFSFRREGMTDRYVIAPRFGRPMAIRLELAAPRVRIARATVNGMPAAWSVQDDAVGRPRVEITAARASRYEVEVTWAGEAPALPSAPAVAVSGRRIEARWPGASLLGMSDPQGALAAVRSDARGFAATAAGRPGFRTVFVRLAQGQMRWWAPVGFEIRPPEEILPDPVQDGSHLRFQIRDNLTGEDSGAVAMPAAAALPGTSRLSLRMNSGVLLQGEVANWTLSAPPGTRFETVDLSSVFNDRVTRIFRQEYLSPRSPYCSLAIPKQGIGSWCRFQAGAPIDDSGLRAAAARGGGFLRTPQGIPFATPGPGAAPNVAFVSQWDNQPRAVEVPLRGRARHLYLLMAGSTNSMQSRCENGEVVVRYADGGSERLELVNPVNWWPIDEDYWIDDYAFRRPEAIPPRVDLRDGAVRTLDPVSFAGRGRPVPGGAAEIVDLPLRPDLDLRSLSVRAVANEVVVGLMAATLVR